MAAHRPAAAGDHAGSSGACSRTFGWLGCLPRYHHEASSEDGNVTEYRILTSTDGRTFSRSHQGTLAGGRQDEGRHLSPAPARYVRFEIRAANGSPAITELTVGGRP